MERREFLKTIGAVAVTAMPLAKMLTSCSVGDDRHQTLTILHTNDVHSHIDPFPEDDPRYHGLGGYARRQAYIDKTIVERGADNTMVFESGDMFQGTPYFNYYKGTLEMQLMNRMHIDAVTIGNHEFDNGVGALCNCIEMANFPFLNANYKIADARMHRLVSPYKIFNRGGMRIGVFGLGMRLEGLVSRFNHEGVMDGDPIEAAREASAFLRKEGCKIIIALTHIGYSMVNTPDDISLAMATTDVDMILGGHSHTFLARPDYITNAVGRKVLVNQVGFGGINVGRIDIAIKGDGGLAYINTENRNMDATV